MRWKSSNKVNGQMVVMVMLLKGHSPAVVSLDRNNEVLATNAFLKKITLKQIKRRLKK